MNSRIEQLSQWLAENPEDSFLHYALAMEYKNYSVVKAKEILENLIKKSPQYLPTYYQLAEIYAEHGQWELAKNIFEKGISLSQILNEQKTLVELQRAYQNWKDEYEL